MSVSGAIGELVAERWIERTMQSYPAETLPHLRGERDAFRNPAGHLIEESLTTLACELMGAMDESVLSPALDAIVRLRAVQGFGPSGALRFIFELRAIVAEVLGTVPDGFEERIDELSLIGFDRYMACREQIAGLRERELRRFAALGAAQ